VGFLGCFVDSTTRDLPHSLGTIDTIDGCRVACANAGYTYPSKSV